MEPLMTSDEVADYLKVDVVTIRRLVNRGELAAYRVGGEYRFTRPDLEDYLHRQRIPAGAHTSSNAPFDLLNQLMRKLFPGQRQGIGGVERFTQPARQTVMLAQKEAQRLNHNYIGTEHLVLGLLRNGEGVAAQVLNNWNIDLNQARSQVEIVISRGKQQVLIGRGLTPRAEKVLEYAVDEARRLNHSAVDTGHLLLGLLREGEGVGVGVLEHLGVNLEQARAQTIHLLNEQQAPQPPEA